MADPKLQGLFAELGIGPQNEDAAIAKVTQERELGGSSKHAAAFNSGNANRQGIQNLLGGVVGGIGGLITGEGGRGFKEFGRDVKAGMNNARDQAVAQGMGVSVQDLRRGRKIREELSGQSTPNTGDANADQQAQLDQIIKTANKHGDAQLVARAHQKKMALKMQQEAFEKADLANQKARRDVDFQAETDSAGRTVRLVGDDPQGAISKAIQNEDGSWTVIRADGTQLDDVDGLRLIFADPEVESALAKLRPRRFETLPAQMQATITANKINPTKKRDELADFATQASIVADMTGTLLGMHDPRIAFADSQKAATGADRVMTFVDTFSNLFTRAGDKQSNITYDGRRVSAQGQYDKATDQSVLESYLTENNFTLDNILPPHLRNDQQAAQLFQANIMQLAYLDARLQEPSNRGLSDNDIKAALERIGVGSPNPAVFALRQKEVLGRLLNRVTNLGMEFAPLPGSDITKRDLIEFVYQPDVTDRISGVATSSVQGLDEFLSTMNQPPNGEEAPAELSDDDFLESI